MRTWGRITSLSLRRPPPKKLGMLVHSQRSYPRMPSPMSLFFKHLAEISTVGVVSTESCNVWLARTKHDSSPKCGRLEDRENLNGRFDVRSHSLPLQTACDIKPTCNRSSARA